MRAPPSKSAVSPNSPAATMVPSTPTALWCWLRGDEPGALVLAGRELETLLAESFLLEGVVEGFLHQGGRDLTGYEDGTENPVGEAAGQRRQRGHQHGRDHQQPAGLARLPAARNLKVEAEQ